MRFLNDGSAGSSAILVKAVLVLPVWVLEVSKASYLVFVSCQLGGGVGIISVWQFEWMA